MQTQTHRWRGVFNVRVSENIERSGVRERAERSGLYVKYPYLKFFFLLLKEGLGANYKLSPAFIMVVFPKALCHRLSYNIDRDFVLPRSSSSYMLLPATFWRLSSPNTVALGERCAKCCFAAHYPGQQSE